MALKDWFTEPDDNDVKEKSSFKETPHREEHVYTDFDASANVTCDIKIWYLGQVDDIKEVAEDLQKKRAVILNLNKLSETDIKSAYQFINGSAFTLGSKIYSITKNVYLISPKTFHVAEENRKTPTELKSDREAAEAWSKIGKSETTASQVEKKPTKSAKSEVKSEKKVVKPTKSSASSAKSETKSDAKKQTRVGRRTATKSDAKNSGMKINIDND